MLIALILFCSVLLALVIFQALLIAGAPLGRFAWGGQDVVLPRSKRIGSAISILLYIAFAWIAAEKAQSGGLLGDSPVVQAAMWVITAYLALGIGMNAISRSKPERLTMVPVAGVLAVLALVIALG